MDRWIMVLVFLFLNILLVSFASPVAEADPDPNLNIKIQIKQSVGGNYGPETPAEPTPKKSVKAAFKIKNAEYNDNLRDPNSDEYKTLKKEVEESVKSALRRQLPGKVVDYKVEFFRNGSVIVDSTVTTTEGNQKTADEIISDALKNSGLDWLDASSVSVGVRLCVPGQDSRAVQEACTAMKQDNSQLDITCVNARDRYDCLQRLITEEVDVARGDAEDIFLAKDLPGADLSVVATIRSEEKLNETYQYLSVAVVRRSTITGLQDLQGKKSCHTGYGKTAGWHVPLAKLLEKGQLTPNCAKAASVDEIDLSAVSSYFGQACIPGNWVPDDEINNRLKNDYSNLCQLCGNPSQCSDQDAHAGYQGALKCLLDSNGDVAWTKHDVVGEFFDNRPAVNKGDFGLLCPDGRIVGLDSVDDDCNWAARPWSAWLTRANEEDKDAIVAVLAVATGSAVQANSPPKSWGEALLGIKERSGIKYIDYFYRDKDAIGAVLAVATGSAVQANSPPKSWGEVLLGIKERSGIKYIDPPVSPNTYLNQADFETTISNQGCVADSVRLCVNSDVEQQKCTELAAVLKSRRVQPALVCVAPNSGEDCVAAVTKGDADIVSLDGGDMFKGHKANQITPVISEVYGEYDATYFAVAVVRANSGITSLAQLKGKKSCHTGIQKTAGWKIPTVTLLEEGLLNTDNSKDKCDYVGQVGTFFNESCAPGAKLPKYDANGTNPASLCNLCAGNKDPGAIDPLNSKCARDSSESYYSYTGAFRCLVEGGGDVAFIKHTTVIGDTNGNSNHTWNQNLQASEFRLLCKNDTDADVFDYESCHLARVPSHKVVTGFNTPTALKEQIRILLLRASETLPQGQDIFDMFGDYGSYHDIIFKSSATTLINLSDNDVNQLLNGTYYKALIKLDACQV